MLLNLGFSINLNAHYVNGMTPFFNSYSTR